MNVLEKFSLKGKTAIITGGTSGLGKAMAESLANAGADISIIGRRKELGLQVEREISEKTGRKVLFINGDVRYIEDVKNFVKKVMEEFGKIDILINSAGINIRKNVEEMSEEEAKEVFETNFWGTWNTCKIVGKYMIEKKYGRIINIGSMLSFVTLPGRSIYASTKGAIVQLTRTLAIEWAKYNITVNCICPGVFDTPINEKILKDPEIKKFFLERIPIGRLGNPEELGPLAIFLSSDACPFLTGSAIIVDGGWTCV
jgi:NAD(P)-dependent dehydrogenase (short-subunit alcohol dehydrogenase family)